jgi:hypothetical protein
MELGAAKARAASAKTQANPASLLVLLESLISSSILTQPAMGLAEQRLAQMELECSREAFQLWIAMTIIGLFDRFRRRRSDAFRSRWAQVHLDCCRRLRVNGFDVEMGYCIEIRTADEARGRVWAVRAVKAISCSQRRGSFSC